MDCLKTEFCSATNSNDVEAAELLLKEKGVDIYSKDDKGMTLFHIVIEKRIQMFHSAHHQWSEEYAAKKMKKNERFIDTLLKHATTNPNLPEEMWLLNFCAACTLESLASAERLLEKIVDVNQSVSENSCIWSGYTALHFAAHCNKIETIKMLISKGGNLLAFDAKGVTPLDMCLKSFNVEQVISLLTCLSTWKDILFSDGKTKLMDYISVLHSETAHAKFLQNVDKAVRISLPDVSALWPGYTLLHIAVTLLRDLDREIIFDLLAQGADVTHPDSQGSTPGHLAFRLGKHFHVCALFHHHEKLLNPLDKDNLSHLHVACAENRLKVVKKLLTMEANIDIAYNGKPLATVKPGWTPLHTACFTEHLTVTKMLLGAGANLLQTDAEGLTAIHRLLGTNGKKHLVLDILIASEQFKECTVKGNGLTHLHVMAYWNKTEIIDRLLDLGSDIEAVVGEMEDANLKQFVGCRPLHIAIMNNHLDTVKILLKRGADIFAKKPDGTYLVSEVLTGKYNKSVLELIVSLIWADKKLQKRMGKEMGLTMLHVVCYALDIEKIKNLSKKQAAVNARIQEKSPTWPGFTPLHVLVSLGVDLAHRKDIQEKVDESLKLLLDRKADVTLTDVQGLTPVLLNLDHRFKKQGQIRASLLMERHCDFSVNPENKDGISHFYIACVVCNPKAVQGFLQCGADANQPVDKSAAEFARKYPLHLALSASSKRIFGAEMQLKTVDVLLEYGADVNTVDARSWTPLHHVAKCGPTRQKLLDRIVKTDTDINKETTDGKTPFEILIQYGASIKEIKYFINHGSRVNGYNRIDYTGYMAIIISNTRYEKLWSGILKLMMSLPDVAEVDERGGNAIYNTIYTMWSCRRHLNEKDFGDLIDQLIKLGCNIRQQDRQGMTSLHVAVGRLDCQAVNVLLKCGADVNLVDSAGKSPFSYCFGSVYCGATKAAIISHLRKLKIVGLEVSQLNCHLLNENPRTNDGDEDGLDNTTLLDQVEKTKKVKIGQRGRTLYDYVFQNDEVKIISLFTPAERDIVSEVLEKIDYEAFSSLKCLLKLQYRKVLERLSLITLAAESFNTLLGFPLPDLCVKIIFKFLINVELKCLVSAAMESDDLEMSIDC